MAGWVGGWVAGWVGGWLAGWLAEAFANMKFETKIHLHSSGNHPFKWNGIINNFHVSYKHSMNGKQTVIRIVGMKSHLS